MFSRKVLDSLFSFNAFLNISLINIDFVPYVHFQTQFMRQLSFQRNWPIEMTPTVHSNFTIESKNQLHNKICQSWKYMTPWSFGFEYLSLIHVFPKHIGGSPMYFNALINQCKLSSDSKEISGKMTGVMTHLLFHGHRLGLTLYTRTPVVVGCLKSLYWQH